MKNSRLAISAAAASVVALLAASSLARAADIDPSYLEDAGQTPVEFGSGWYLRGDVSWTHGAKFETGYTAAEPMDTRSLYDYNDQLTLRAGFGYQVTPNFRWEVSAEHVGNGSADINTTRTFAGGRSYDIVFPDGSTTDDTVYFDRYGHVTGSEKGIWAGAIGLANVVPINGTERIESSYNADMMLASGYFDLPTMGRFKPYVGAGVGAARVQYSERRTWDCNATQNETCHVPAGAMGQQVNDFVALDASETSWQLALQASIGAAVKLTDRLSMDVGYSYTQIGTGAALNYDDGSMLGDDGVSLHQLRAGLRYEIW